MSNEEVKVEKLPTIASCTCSFIAKLLQVGKDVVAFCLTVQKSHWLFCILSWLSITQIWRGTRRLLGLNKKFVWDNCLESSSYWMQIYKSFVQKGPER